MNEERIKELFANEDFVKDLFESESYEEAQAKFAANDIDVSVDELKKSFELLMKKENGELNDEELEAVAGGSLIGALIYLGIIIAGTTAGCIYSERKRKGKC